MGNAWCATNGGADSSAEAQEWSTVPTEVLARLDRLASASVLAAGLAHEIASPLSALLGALDALDRRLRDARRRADGALPEVERLTDDLVLATESTGAITDLIHDFQAFLRAAPEPSGDGCDVRESVERALRLAQPRLRAVCRVALELRASPYVSARGSRIVQVVLNLLLNAAAALADRAVARNLVTVRVDVLAGRALIEVSDNGPGLPAELGEHLFEVGARPRAGRASSGLGLPICRDLVQKMDGELTVATLPGAGTTFIVSLPLLR